MVSHSNGLRKIIKKKRMSFQIQNAFSFLTWANLYLETEGDFTMYLGKVKKIYDKDKLFKKYLKEDSKFFSKKLDKNQLEFFLEEFVMTYLWMFKKIKLKNDFVQKREKWILTCYPGVPPKALVYLIQKNPFKFKIDNPYLGFYNIENKKLYDFNRIDLETWDYN